MDLFSHGIGKKFIGFQRPLTYDLTGGCQYTTNNRMNLVSVIEGLDSIDEPSEVDIYTDSQYVANAINKGWINNWIEQDWRGSNNKPIRNRDLWQRLLPLLKKHRVRIQWVDEHSDDAVINERCVLLANSAAMRRGLPKDRGYEQHPRF